MFTFRSKLYSWSHGLPLCQESNITFFEINCITHIVFWWCHLKRCLKKTVYQTKVDCLRDISKQMTIDVMHHWLTFCHLQWKKSSFWRTVVNKVIFNKQVLSLGCNKVSFLERKCDCWFQWSSNNAWHFKVKSKPSFGERFSYH